MKQWLRQVCTSLNIPAPSIVLSDIKFNDEVEFRRYCGTLIRSFDGNQLSHVRRYALTDYDAQEDTLLSASGKCIRDLNYYSVTTLQAKVQLLKNENMQLQLRATFLYDQLRQRTKSNE
ncbi:hypothetical protein GmHk_02G004796 [Glycine max]|nr:hypothetical protein GmHk_02G004796 [Glycine max]